MQSSVGCALSGNHFPASVFQPLVVALILNRLDYDSNLLIGIPANSVGLLAPSLHRSDDVTDSPMSLHWQRVPERKSGSRSLVLLSLVRKVATLTYRVALHCDAPFVTAHSCRRRTHVTSSLICCFRSAAHFINAIAYTVGNWPFWDLPRGQATVFSGDFRLFCSPQWRSEG